MKLFFVVILLAGLFMIWQGLHPSTIHVAKYDAALSTNVDFFLVNVKASGEQYIEAETIVEIEGIIKEINHKNNRLTVILGANTGESSVIICDMDENQNSILEHYKPTDSIQIKGIYKGFLKDAILLNCIVFHSEINE